MSKHGRILVAMSGGVDSSVAAVMLHEQGYEVIGLTMKTWDYASSGTSSKETGCCSLDSINDARSLAVGYGFPHYILDIRSELGDFVIDNFVDEYLAGRTPGRAGAVAAGGPVSRGDGRAGPVRSAGCGAGRAARP